MFIGTILIKIVRKLNVSLSCLIFNTYFTCLLLATSALYTTSSILFNNESNAVYAYSAANFLFSLLYCGRLLWLTNSGHNFVEAMKRCTHQLDRIKFTDTTINADDVQLLKQDFRYYCEAPIVPFSAFTLSNSTLVGTCATIITYLIVLVQFKGSENGTTFAITTSHDKGIYNTSNQEL